MYNGQPEEAETLILEAHKVRERLWPPDTLALAYSANNVYLLYDALVQHEKADQYISQAVDILKKQLPTTHPHVAFLINNQSVTRRALGDLAGARDLLLEAFRYNKDAGRDYLLAMNAINLGNLFTDLNELDQSRHYFQEALSKADSVFSNPSDHLTSLYDGYARLHWHEGKLQLADSLFRLALQQKKLIGDKNSVEVARSYHSLGLIAIDRQAWSEAGRFFSKSYLIRARKLGEDHPFSLESKYQEARCNWEQAHQDEAIQSWKTCLAFVSATTGSRISQHCGCRFFDS